MKKLFLLLASVFMSVAVVGLVSCKKDGGDIVYKNMSFGILKYVNGNYIVTTDANENLYVVNEDEFPSGTFSQRRGRVFIGYNVINNIDPSQSYYDENASGNYNIEMIAFLSFVRPEIKTYSEMSDEEITAMGGDPIDVNEVTFGNGYINARFMVNYDSSSGVEHKLTMVYHDENKEDGKLHLWLMHNAFTDDYGTEKLLVYSSFNMEDILPDEVNEADVVLHWYWYTSDQDLTLTEYTREVDFKR